MSTVKSFIVVEDRLAEMFDMLPTIKDKFKPKFGYGDKKELNAFLKNRKRTSPYPLIWLLYPYKEVHNKRNVSIKNLELVIAVQTNSSMENSERIIKTYKGILIPLLDDINSLFLRANILNVNKEYEVEKHPNYSDSEEGNSSAGTLIWDAIKLTYDITITDDCLRNIKF
tara:strand:- start:2723 stop:3232 length:510 start_codon:yes stop_codon:yes gene_type:complete